MKPGTARGYGALFITSTVWGTTWVVSKIGVHAMPALQMSAIRQFLAGALFLIFFLFIKKERFPSLPDLLWSIMLGTLMFVFANGLSTWSLNYIPSGFSALIGALYPLSVVIIERVFLKIKTINALTLIGLLLGLTGVGIVFYDNAFHSLNDGFGWGLLLSITAMLSWSVGTVLIMRKKSGINPYHSTGWQMFFSGLILYVFSLITNQHIPFAEIPLVGWEVIWYLVILGSVVSFAAFIYSIKHLPAAIASLYAYINPLVAMVLAALFVDEKLTTLIIWGSIVTLVGVFLVNLSLRKSHSIKSPAE